MLSWGGGGNARWGKCSTLALVKHLQELSQGRIEVAHSLQGYLEIKLYCLLSSVAQAPCYVVSLYYYGCDWVPLEDRSRVLSFAEPLRCRTPPLPPMPPPSARSPHSHLSPPPSERLEFWRVGVPWGRPFFSSGKGSGEQDSKVTCKVHMQ